MSPFFITIRIRFTFAFTLIVKLNSFQITGLHFLHTNYCKTHLFSASLSRKFVMTNRRNFHVKYSTLYFIFIKCVLCEAVGSADQNHKTFKTFLFFLLKKKQKNPTSATLAKGVLLSCSFKNHQGTGNIFSEDHSKNLHLSTLANFYFVRFV